MRPQLPFAPACERNKVPILAQLLNILPGTGALLEIGSGTGQHAVYMAPRFPHMTWQPTDLEAELEGLRARLEAEGCHQIQSPVPLDVAVGPWPEQLFEAAFSANTAHIMGWPEVCAMFEGIGGCLIAGGVFCLYGPFNRGGGFTAPSNAAFDADLRARDPRMGLRDVEQLARLAECHQMRLDEELAMPANNFLLVFVRDAP